MRPNRVRRNDFSARWTPLIASTCATHWARRCGTKGLYSWNFACRIHSGAAESVRLGGVLVDITDVEPVSRDALSRPHAMARATHARLVHMGDLLGSLTHELNQPLMAILSNAEAGARFLQAPSPDFGELDSIFREICKDNQRAVAVIGRLRNLHLRADLQPEAFDLKDTP